MTLRSEANKIISKDGVEVCYWVTWEKGKNSPFFVLHPGAALNHTSLKIIEHGLNDLGYATINLDPRGSGYSGHPIAREYFQLDRLTDDLSDIIHKEGVEKPRILTHSFGFMPAVDYAVKSGNVKDLVGLCSSHNFKDTAPSKALFHLFDKVLIYSEYAGSLTTLVSHKIKGDQRGYNDQSSLTDSEFGTWLSIVDVALGNARSHVQGQRECNTWDISPQLKELDVPLLLVYGSNDQMVRPDAGKYISDLVRSRCQVKYIDGTHSMPMKNPYEVLNIIDND